ncbi:MAG: transporter [Thermoanaerobaculia bacterium]|jgi:hypothetical protein
MSSRIRLTLAIVAMLVPCALVSAQEMEPRAFSPAPVGMQFAAVVYGHSEGDLVFDPTLPIEGAEATVDSLALGYVRVLSLGGMTARVGAVLPFADGTATGLVGGAARRRDVTGMADPRLVASLLFFGAPAMTPAEFMKRPKGPVAGVSFQLGVPLGEYDSDYAINLGANRWIARAVLGGSIQKERWIFEGAAGASVSTDNDDFYGGKHVEQDPIWAVQAHVVRELRRRGSWLAFDATWYWGGRSTTDGVPSSLELNNTRLGLTYTRPLTPRQSLKVAVATGVITEGGTDFDQIQIAYQASFMPKR